MNMGEFQNLTINPRNRQTSLHEQGRLPGVDHILAAQNESLPPVREPHGYPVQHPSATAYNHAQPAQAHTPAYHGYTHASIEASTLPAAFSSPRGMYADDASDTSSDSSGSRESSTCPRNSYSSATTTKARSTRAKRGSESQGSGSDCGMKRPDISKGELWCTDCECAVADCTSPKVHKARVKKIVKEKSSRSTQACILQGHEDLTQNALNFGGYKIQQPGNKKKSGMKYDKKEVLVSSQITMDVAVERIARRGRAEYEGFIREARKRVEAHLVHGLQTALPAGSLMSGPDGEGPCVHELRNMKCEDSIECRKSRRSVQFNNNINQILDSAERPASHQLSAGGARSSSSTPRRR
ncbi:hypothetical protein MBLNU13_g01893t1 [Cladosporium sp. NU13]